MSLAIPLRFSEDWARDGSSGFRFMSAAENVQIERAKKAREFQRFYREHYEMGFRFLRALRFPFNTLRDILSQCFELAWNRFDEYLMEDRPAYWFYSILKNKSGYERRKLSKTGEILAGSIAGDRFLDRSDVRETPEDSLLEQEKLSYIYDYIARLPSIYADVVKLRLSGFDYADIAESLGISVTNAQTRMSRAVVMLQPGFAEYLKNYHKKT